MPLFSVRHDHYFHFEDGSSALIPYLERIMSLIEEANAKVDALTASAAKIGAETTASLALIEELKAAQVGSTITADFMAKLDTLGGHLTAIDGQVPDVEAPTE